jgi:hypothetical protein
MPWTLHGEEKASQWWLGDDVVVMFGGRSRKVMGYTKARGTNGGQYRIHIGEQDNNGTAPVAAKHAPCVDIAPATQRLWTTGVIRVLDSFQVVLAMVSHSSYLGRCLGAEEELILSLAIKSIESRGTCLVLSCEP